ncbi:hypothetical protein B0T25DRAFT_221419 [Lasiosphaeria hispida]|uniref:Uncharacterized protein n=1 Tax=Lasiosphaeria hispida TaxID=260671 RepID=A0AAJ0MEV2_9PEZI|nr:hypothetical protein B0T25DRAFT_221419 [Lasiosphaeria hispida]
MEGWQQTVAHLRSTTGLGSFFIIATSPLFHTPIVLNTQTWNPLLSRSPVSRWHDKRVNDGNGLKFITLQMVFPLFVAIWSGYGLMGHVINVNSREFLSPSRPCLDALGSERNEWYTIGLVIILSWIGFILEAVVAPLALYYGIYRRRLFPHLQRGLILGVFATTAALETTFCLIGVKLVGGLRLPEYPDCGSGFDGSARAGLYVFWSVILVNEMLRITGLLLLTASGSRWRSKLGFGCTELWLPARYEPTVAEKEYEAVSQDSRELEAYSSPGLLAEHFAQQESEKAAGASSSVTATAPDSGTSQPATARVHVAPAHQALPRGVPSMRLHPSTRYWSATTKSWSVYIGSNQEMHTTFQFIAKSKTRARLMILDMNFYVVELFLCALPSILMFSLTQIRPRAWWVLMAFHTNTEVLVPSC